MSNSEPNLEYLKEQVAHAAQFLFDCGVMQHSGHGNISARLDGNRMVLTQRSNIVDLRATDLAVVSFDGEILEGEIEPTTAEIVAMHAEIYRIRENVGAVIHTHSPHVTAFALAHEPLPAAYEALMRFGVAEPIPVAAWAPRGSEGAVANIRGQVESHPDAPAILLANHGLLAFHENPMVTARLIAVMEEAAEMTLGARSMGGERSFPSYASKTRVGSYDPTRFLDASTKVIQGGLHTDYISSLFHGGGCPRTA